MATVAALPDGKTSESNGGPEPPILSQHEQTIRLHVQYIKHSIKTGDFGYVHASKAQLLLSGRYKIASGDAGDEKIKEIMTASAYTVQTFMGEFNENVEKLKGTPPDKPAWEKKILENSKLAQERAVEAISSAANEAISAIRELPEPAREGATNVFLTAANFIGDLLNAFVGELKGVFYAVVDFLKGIWTKVKAAYNAVVGAVKSAVSFIKGIFGLDLKYEDDADAGLRFIGRLNWPGAVGIATASAALAYVSNQLIRRGYQYSSQTLEKKNVEGTTVIESRTSISPTQKTPLVGASDAEKVWFECVNDLGDDGHYIPVAATAEDS